VTSHTDVKKHRTPLNVLVS